MKNTIQTKESGFVIVLLFVKSSAKLPVMAKIIASEIGLEEKKNKLFHVIEMLVFYR